MFCEQCGAQIAGGARFCESCGAPVPGAVEALVIPAPLVATVTISDEPPEALRQAQRPVGYAVAHSMTEAAAIDMERAEEWSCWDDERHPIYNGSRWLRRYAEREDRKYDGTESTWVVSPDGAIGVVGEPGDFEEGDVNWWLFTPAVPWRDLPRWQRDIGW